MWFSIAITKNSLYVPRNFVVKCEYMKVRNRFQLSFEESNLTQSAKQVPLQAILGELTPLEPNILCKHLLSCLSGCQLYSHPGMFLERHPFIEPYSLRVYPPRCRLRADVYFRNPCGVATSCGVQQQKDASGDSKNERIQTKT